jgi:hypothetical protein
VLKIFRIYKRSWVLNPAGWMVREEIKNRVERLGAPLMVAAELHNPDLQLSLVVGNVGVGMARASFLRKHPLRARLSIIAHRNFEISIRIAFFRARNLGTREQVAFELQRILVKDFEGLRKDRKSSAIEPTFHWRCNARSIGSASTPTDFH